MPRFELQANEGGQRKRLSRVLVGITGIPRGGPAFPQEEWTREYLDEHPCPLEEVWLIEEIKRAGGPVSYDANPEEYWTKRSRMEWARLQNEAAPAEQNGDQGEPL